MIRLKLHIVFLFSLIGLVSFAQNLKADYKLHCRAIDSLAAYTLEEVHYEYDSLNQGGEISKCVVKKNRDLTLINVANIETITTRKQMLVIDHEDEYMSLYQIPDTNKKEVSTSDAGIDNFINSFDSIIFLGQRNDLKSYSLKIEEGDIKEIQLFFSVQNNLLVKKVEYYRLPYLNDGIAKNFVVYNYSFLNNESSKEEISIEKYIELKNGRYSLKKEYQNYELETF